MNKFDFILLDADGTLLDYDQEEEWALQAAFRQYGIIYQEAIREKYRHINGKLWLEYEFGKVTKEKLQLLRFEKLFQELKIETKIDCLEFSRCYLNAFGEKAFLMKGARELCRKLNQELELPLVLVSNGTTEIQQKRLNRTEINSFFSHIFTSDEVGYQKPQKEFFEKVFLQLGKINRERILIVGDSLTADIEGGNNAGIKTCWYNPSRLPHFEKTACCYEIQNLLDLLPLLS